jgi:hypothetical protein
MKAANERAKIGRKKWLIESLRFDVETASAGRRETAAVGHEASLIISALRTWRFYQRSAQTYAAKHRVKCCREKSGLVASFIAVKLPGEAMCNN